MNPKLLLNLLLIPISWKIPPLFPLDKGSSWGLKSSNNQGFTLIDVIIGMLIASIFLLVSLQAMVVEAYFRIAAQSSSEGLLLIQQDLEEVRFYASTLTANSGKCNATTNTSGYGKYLSDQIDDSTKDGIVSKQNLSINNLKYNLTRTATVSSTSPFNVLQLSYSVKKTDNNKEVATLYTEVIPDAAFQCN